MAETEPARRPAWLHMSVALLFIGGAGLIGLSFVWPGAATGRANWSPQQALAYQAAALKLHSLSHESIHAAGSNSEKAVREQLEQAKAEYDVLRAQLDSAIAWPKHVAMLLRIAGFLLAGAGAALIFYKGSDG